jgi:hypothetical protein
VYHPKGNGALGYFEVTADVSQWTKAAFLNKVGKRTPSSCVSRRWLVSRIQVQARTSRCGTDSTTRQKRHRMVDNAVRKVLRAGEPITFRRVASVARVSTGWLYAQPDVKERITRLRGQPDGKAGPPPERASDASNDAVVRAVRQGVGTLDEERRRLLARVEQLKARVEVLYGDFYAKRAAMPSGSPSAAKTSRATTDGDR